MDDAKKNVDNMANEASAAASNAADEGKKMANDATAKADEATGGSSSGGPVSGVIDGTMQVAGNIVEGTKNLAASAQAAVVGEPTTAEKAESTMESAGNDVEDAARDAKTSAANTMNDAENAAKDVKSDVQDAVSK